jgi:hypothetical protein
MTEDKLRLHITPFSKDLAQSILSSHSSLAADSISYHTLETFPEHCYGYIELPIMEAEKLKKKLNGSILKGKKLRIEHARPQKRRFEPAEDEEEEEESTSDVKGGPRMSKKARQSTAELQGHELDPERKIKRGWTEPGKGGTVKPRPASRVASKYTNQPECMFRVQLPPNKEIKTSGPKGNEKDRATKKEKKATVVHEFEKSAIQPSFLRDRPGTGNVGVATEYVDGVGWVDKDGNVLEEGTKKLRNRGRINDLRGAQITDPSSGNPASKDEQGSSSDKDGNGRQKKNELISTSANKASTPSEKSTSEAVDEETSSSGTSLSDSESSSDPDEESEQQSVPEPKAAEADHLGEVKADSASVHPLEALFKQPKQSASQTRGKRPLEIKTTFNFFGPDGESTMPETPFTSRDLQMRGLRSAAPTPDTALPTRRFFAESDSPSSDDPEDEAGAEGPSGGPSGGPTDGMLPTDKSKQTEGESEFAKWFWEHRGENNRAWKRRRRETMKEKRQRESRQKGRKIG